MEIWVARHGETDWNRAGRFQGNGDMPLNARGRAQASALADAVREAGIGAVYTSDLPRALETAAIIAQALRLPAPVADTRLRERALGPFQGLTYAEAAAQTGRSLNEGGWVDLDGADGVEPDDAVLKRLLAACSDIAAAWPDVRILAICHGSAMAALERGLGGGAERRPLTNGALFRVLRDPEWRLI